MIVRINQFDAPRPEAESGWPADGRLGPLVTPWPEGTRAFEVLILEQDEQRKPLPESFRQQQLRQLIPQAVAALREPGEEVVVRLDGPLAEREILPAYKYLADPLGNGRFAVTAASKLEPAPREVLAGVRVQPTAQTLHAMCSDAALGLERSVRLRAFSVPDALAAVVLDIEGPEDERWPEVLRQSGFVLTNARGMLALHVLTARYDSAAVKSRLMQRLAALAQGAGAQQAQSAQRPKSPSATTPV